MRLSVLMDGYADVPRDAVVSGMTLDSRAVQRGDLFVALAGRRRHGLEFLSQAVASGASAVLYEGGDACPRDVLADHDELPAVELPQLAVRIGSIASRFYGHPSRRMTIVGVTGTNGKSSFVHLLSRALQRRRRAGTLGTLGAGPVGREQPLQHTTPDAITVHRELALMAESGVDAVAMEVSSHALDQARVGGVVFDVAVFTNLSRDHLDYHRDMDDYAAAKARLFAVDGLELAIFNLDDQRVEQLRRATHPQARQLGYGLQEADVTASDLRFDRQGLAFRLRTPDGESTVEAGLLGRFNVYNLLAVAATLHGLGWSHADVAAALAESAPVAGRMNVLSAPDRPTVLVDYAHTPDALEQCLRAVVDHGFRNVICVFGCGGDRDRGKRPLMARAAVSYADRVIVTDDNPRSEDGDRIVRDILAGLDDASRVTVIRDRASAIGEAIASADPEDLVVIAGKGHENYQEIAGIRRHFDDAETARRLLEIRP